MRSPSFTETSDALDSADSLSAFRARFHLPPGQIYLDGNSLGLLSTDAELALKRVIEEWKRLGIGGWLDGQPPWFTMAEEAARLIALIMGGDSEEVIFGSSTTVNLHQLLATLYAPQGNRTKVLIDVLAFPTDRYAVTSHMRLRGLEPQDHLVIAPTEDGFRLAEETIMAAMTESVAIVLLPSVVYTTGQLLDMRSLTAESHRRGCLIGFDCSHSAGLIPHALSEWGVDFAFWCGYKYLNGGPGSASGLYLNRRHFGKGPGIAGWFSSDKERQFDMAEELIPGTDAGALQIGTPPILGIAPLLGALPLTHEAGIDRIRSKSLAMTEHLINLVETELEAHGFRIATPREAQRRGGHIALIHQSAAGICAALKAAGVVPDFRPPNIVRLAPSPLYNTFAECREAVERLRGIMEERTYENHSQTRGMVA